MKKFSIILAFTVILSIFFQTIAFSSPNPAPNMCAAGNYPISGSVSRGIQKVLGINFFTTKVAEMIIKNQISKLIQKGSVNVNIKAYSAGDLLAGKIRGYSITGKNIVYNDIHISSLKAESLCDFTYFDYKKNPVVLNSPLFVKYNAEITNNGLQNIFSSDNIKESLTGIKLTMNNLVNMGEVDIIDVKPSIANEKINIKANLVYRKMPFRFTIPINISTALKSKDDKIFLSNLKFQTDSPSNDLKFITNLLELNNINIFDLKTVEKSGSDININKIKIVNDKILIEGTFWQDQNTTF